MKKVLKLSLIGSTNAGKSTLLNALVENDVSIVAPKVQTTRTSIKGIFTHKSSQVIVLDTPGIFIPRNNLDKTMLKSIMQAIKSTDTVALLIDAINPHDDTVLEIIGKLKRMRVPYFTIVNKIDAVTHVKLSRVEQYVKETIKCSDPVLVSAKTGAGLESLKEKLHSMSSVSDWIFPEDVISDVPVSFIANEVTRKCLTLFLNHELPYEICVISDKTEYKSDNSIVLHQTIYVLRESQKKIILGERGAKIKFLSQRSRKELESILQVKVHLFLFVKVKKDWKDEPEKYISYLQPAGV